MADRRGTGRGPDPDPTGDCLHHRQNIKVSGLGIPAVVDPALETLASAALALGLLVAGAGLDLNPLKHTGTRTIVWSLVRLLVMPILAVSMGLGVTGVGFAVIAIAAATPTATNGSILACQMSGDAPFMANLIIATQLAGCGNAGEPERTLARRGQRR